MNVMNILFFVFIMLVIPMTIGVSVKKLELFKHWGMCYITSILLMWTIWHLLCIPFWIYQWSFSVLCYIYSGVLLAGATGSFCYSYKYCIQPLNLLSIQRKIKYLSYHEWIYGLIAIGLVLYQVHKTINSDITYNAGDDFIYVSLSNAAIYDDKLGMTGVLGTYEIKSPVKYALQTNIWFISYLAKMCNLPVALIAHTLYPVFLLLLAYMAMYLLSTKVFHDRENRLIFLIMVSVLYIYGFYSMYSVTFRLLGPIWQGKAILAVFFLPMLLYICPIILQQKYSHRFGIFLGICSVAAVSMSLGGVVTMATIWGIFILFTLCRKEREWKYLLYLLWGMAYPCGVGIFYLIMR